MLIWSTIVTPAHAGTGSGPFTLARVIDTALRNHPGIQAAQTRIRSAEAEAELARSAYLPQASLQLQENRATDNNTTGLLFPQTAIPGISGPVTSATSLDSYWGSAAGALIAWDVSDFGARRASLDAALAARDRASASADLTRLDVAFRAADAYFATLGTQAVEAADQANMDRARVFEASVATLVKNGLRPGVDLSRASAELAAARIRLTHAHAQAATSKALLAQRMGIGGPITVTAEDFLVATPHVDVATPSVEANPAVRAQKTSVRLATAQRAAAALAYNPKLSLIGTVYGRGSQAGPGNSLGNGTIPDRLNAAAGLTMTLPLLEDSARSARVNAATENERYEQARLEETRQAYSEALDEAEIGYQSALTVVDQTPALLQAASSGDQQVTVRYQAGLATLVDVADAERLLTQAEIDAALAKIRAWQALLKLAYTQGNLSPFVPLAPVQGVPR